MNIAPKLVHDSKERKQAITKVLGPNTKIKFSCRIEQLSAMHGLKPIKIITVSYLLNRSG